MFPSHDHARIDFHAHVIVDLPDFAGRFGDRRWPTFENADGLGRLSRDGQVVRSVARSAWSLTDRLDDMDAASLQHQVLSPIPPLICDWGDAAPAAEWAEHINEAIGELVRTRPDRFSGLGTVPLHHPDDAVAVLVGAHEAGLAGVEIGTMAGDRELDHPELSDFFDVAEELGMIIFVHPLILPSTDDLSSRITGLAQRFGLEMATDTAIAASRLVFGGVTGRCPDLRICLAHGGGTFFWALSRIAHLWDRDADHSSSALVRNVYADSVVYNPANLRYLCERIGADRIVFGTDYPLPAQDDLAGSILSGLAEADAEMIFFRTPASLLKRPLTDSETRPEAH